MSDGGVYRCGYKYDAIALESWEIEIQAVHWLGNCQDARGAA